MTTLRKLPTIAPKANTKMKATISGKPVIVSKEAGKLFIETSEKDLKKRCVEKSEAAEINSVNIIAVHAAKLKLNFLNYCLLKFRLKKLSTFDCKRKLFLSCRFAEINIKISK